METGSELIKGLVEAISAGNYWIAVLIVGIPFLFKVKSIADFWDERQRVRIGKLKESIESGHLTGLTKSHLEAELESEYFKQVTGIYKEKLFREELLRVHVCCQGELRFAHFKRAVDLMDFNAGRISVRLGWYEKISATYNFIVGLGILLFCWIAFVFQFELAEQTLNELAKRNLLILLFTFFSFLMIREGGKFYSAILVRKEIANRAIYTE